MLEYMNPNFDIETIPDFDNVAGLKTISMYLDFSIFSTIHKQMPNIDKETEQKYAAILLKNYMTGDTKAFTSQNGIRSNMRKLGPDKIKYLLLKTLIEKDEYNRRVLHKLSPQNYQDECADYVTKITCYGKLDENADWIDSQIPSFIDMYVESSYGSSLEIKDRMEQLCYGNSTTTRALEQLNLEMSMNRIKK